MKTWKCLEANVCNVSLLLCWNEFLTFPFTLASGQQLHFAQSPQAEVLLSFTMLQNGPPGLEKRDIVQKSRKYTGIISRTFKRKEYWSYKFGVKSKCSKPKKTTPLSTYPTRNPKFVNSEFHCMTIRAWYAIFIQHRKKNQPRRKKGRLIAGYVRSVFALHSTGA